jgi:hypothetical protein
MKDAEERRYPPKLDWAVLAIRWVVVAYGFGTVILFALMLWAVFGG